MSEIPSSFWFLFSIFNHLYIFFILTIYLYICGARKRKWLLQFGSLQVISAARSSQGNWGPGAMWLQARVQWVSGWGENATSGACPRHVAAEHSKLACFCNPGRSYVQEACWLAPCSGRWCQPSSLEWLMLLPAIAGGGCGRSWAPGQRLQPIRLARLNLMGLQGPNWGKSPRGCQHICRWTPPWTFVSDHPISACVVMVRSWAFEGFR